ncbi:helix-turn-helix domain-containing protein [Streptomyces sp. NPDC056944]|uniref:helix-turn-helix domain-containing protein n=1 Tax=Streptomyces sp. NPDC056944 TaxID=3345972 RepID=UPI003639BC85
MNSTAEDRTLLPEHRADIAELREWLDRAPSASEPALLRGPDGTMKALPPEVYEALLVVVRALSEGKAVSVAPQETTLTTQEAADMLGVSRPTLVKLLDRGDIPFTRPGRHRRVLLVDVLAYRSERRSKRRRGLDELVELTEEAGLYGD